MQDEEATPLLTWGPWRSYEQVGSSYVARWYVQRQREMGRYTETLRNKRGFTKMFKSEVAAAAACDAANRKGSS